MLVEIRMRTSQLLWANQEQGDNLIDLQAVFDDYWSSNMREITVSGRT